VWWRFTETFGQQRRHQAVTIRTLVPDRLNVEAESGQRFGEERLVLAVDARGGHVAIHGWKTITEIAPASMMQQLEPFCSAFLYTHIDTEGLMQGIPLDVIRELRDKTSRRLIAAGGIRSQEEIDKLDQMGVDAVVGMAIYSGLLAV